MAQLRCYYEGLENLSSIEVAWFATKSGDYKYENRIISNESKRNFLYNINCLLYFRDLNQKIWNMTYVMCYGDRSKSGGPERSSGLESKYQNQKNQNIFQSSLIEKF